MPAGLEILNDHGTILIDNNYTNLAVVAQGSAVIYEGGDFPDYPVGITDIAVTPKAGEMLAVRSSGKCGVINGRYIYGDVGATVYWYIFGKPTASGNAGLQVFNASGELTFDSSRKYARVVDSFTQSGEFTKTYAAGRTYAVIFARRAANVTREAYTDELGHLVRVLYYQGSACRVTNGSIYFGWAPYNARSGVFGSVILPAWASLELTAHVIDVTGY